MAAYRGLLRSIGWYHRPGFSRTADVDEQLPPGLSRHATSVELPGVSNTHNGSRDEPSDTHGGPGGDGELPEFNQLDDSDLRWLRNHNTSSLHLWWSWNGKGCAGATTLAGVVFAVFAAAAVVSAAGHASGGAQDGLYPTALNHPVYPPPAGLSHSSDRHTPFRPASLHPPIHSPPSAVMTAPSAPEDRTGYTPPHTPPLTASYTSVEIQLPSSSSPTASLLPPPSPSPIISPLPPVLEARRLAPCHPPLAPPNQPMQERSVSILTVPVSVRAALSAATASAVDCAHSPAACAHARLLHRQHRAALRR